MIMEHRLQYPSSLSILCSTFLAAFFIFFFVLRMWKKSRVRNPVLKLPPGPPKLPLIGNMHQLVGSLPHHRLRDLAKVYGPIMHLRLGEITNIVISSPETAKEVMKTHDVIFAQRPYLVSTKTVTYNYTDIAFSPYGDYWRQLRKMCIVELLSAKRVQSFRSIREDEVSKLVKLISSSAGSPINFSRKVNSLTYRVISRAAFGKVWKGEEVFVPVVKEVLKESGGFSLADLYPSIKLFHVISGLRPNLKKIHKQLDQLFENIIGEHRAKINAVAEGEDRDLVDVLLNLQEREELEFPLSTDNLKAIIWDIFTAGSETSATTIEWAMSEMIKNPRVMKKAQAEVREVFGRKGNVDEGGLDELNYLELVIKETFRLHPPVPLLLPRESREACKIYDYDIPVGSKVVVNVWSIGRDPNYWTEPMRFYPERFLDSSMDYKGNDFELIPFGAGRRMCPGIMFGMANVELPLAQALYHFDWKLTNELKPADIDMSEVFGAVVKRKNDLFLIPIPHNPLPVD